MAIVKKQEEQEEQRQSSTDKLTKETRNRHYMRGVSLQR
jgi:hypothetical protein